MGQEAGKPAWPKPAGGYQTITGRRYGRRHAYVSFRPTSAKHRSLDRDANPARKQRPQAYKRKISSMLHAMLPVPANSVHPDLTSSGVAEAPGKNQPSSRRPAQEACPGGDHAPYRKPKSEQAGAGEQDGGSMDRKSAEASAWPIPEEEDNASVANASMANASVANASAANASVANASAANASAANASVASASALSFVNIDSYEPDSSGGEEESPGSLGLQRRLDDMIFELGKEFDYLSGLHSYLYTKSCEGTESPAKDAAVKDSLDSPPPEEAVPHRGSPEPCGQPGGDQTLPSPASPGDCAAAAGPPPPPDCPPAPGLGTNQTPPAQAEMVVRPKIRKQTSETHLEKRPGAGPEEGVRSGVATRAAPPAASKTKCVSAPPFFLTQTERLDHDLLFSFPPSGGRREEVERRREEEHECKISSDDDDIWEDLEDFHATCAPFLKREESSECSEGEWSASWTSDSGLEKEPGSSEDSWETLPSPEDRPSPGSSSQDPPSHPPGPPQETPLEEGEVPWLGYGEEMGSSSDEEDPEGRSHFVHPGLFILDGNNNLEDDSSMSEDLDAEWRLLDDFGEGFGMAQAISYVDPQLLTYMALEERLAQAMEAALAHLESLAIDVEQAHPPAPEQTIACLPHIPVTTGDDPSGQEQCCAICCCEYIKDEIATQLPCHHMFHKICVTLWLQKSGTCPVCRHVLTAALPEAPAPTSFVSDQDIPPSNHSAAGTRLI